MEEVPAGAYTIPLGTANVKRQGSDITLVGWGQQVAVLEKAVSLAHTESDLSTLQTDTAKLCTLLLHTMCLLHHYKPSLASLFQQYILYLRHAARCASLI